MTSPLAALPTVIRGGETYVREHDAVRHLNIPRQAVGEARRTGADPTLRHVTIERHEAHEWGDAFGVFYELDSLLAWEERRVEEKFLRETRVPTEPLAAYVERRGSLQQALSIGVIVTGGDEDGGYTVDLTEEERARLQQIGLAYYKSVARGFMMYDAADKLACEVFHVHPCAIWGDAWFDYPDNTELQAALRGGKRDSERSKA